MQTQILIHHVVRICRPSVREEGIMGSCEVVKLGNIKTEFMYKGQTHRSKRLMICVFHSTCYVLRLFPAFVTLLYQARLGCTSCVRSRKLGKGLGTELLVLCPNIHSLCKHLPLAFEWTLPIQASRCFGVLPVDTWRGDKWRHLQIKKRIK